MKPKLAISLGDPAGIGPEITAAALSHAVEICRPVLFGHWPSFAQTYRHVCHKLCRNEEPFAVFETAEAFQTAQHHLQTGDPIPFINCYTSSATTWSPGMDAAAIQLNSLAAAVSSVMNGNCDALTTAPVSKEWIHRISPGFTGHTEYLATRCGLQKDDVTMVFATRNLVVGLISTHIPLAKIPETINEKTYLRTLTHVIEAAKQNTGNTAPCIGVAGVNPHAGENGLLGDEETRFLTPFCVTHEQFEGAAVSGPHPADAIYRDAFNGKYQGVIAAYHDQALIPLKLSGFGGATNVTAGLPFIRTSPDHGTAYDLAGKYEADATAMKTAVETAVRMITYNLTSQEPRD